jgi:hypothetical protein
MWALRCELESVPLLLHKRVHQFVNMSHIDVVLVQDEEETDRVTVRGDAGFTAITQFGSLRGIVEQELNVPHDLQCFWLEGSGELDVPEDVLLEECGIHHGATIFVTLREVLHPREASDLHVGDAVRHATHTKSSAVLRLERVLADLEPSQIEKRADELLQRWEAIAAIV